ncbi:MAG: DNA/RNA nuclease SfsA [Pseudomonadota bacterium]
MQLPPLIEGRLIKRYKRFLADIQLTNGADITAHCPNPGAMTGLADPGMPVWVSTSDNKKRKLPHTLEVVQADGTMVGINTGRPNALAAEAIEAGVIAPLAGYRTLRREVTYGANSRVDILLEDHPNDARPCYVEVKNVHLRRPELAHPTAAEFPDSVTARGTKHLFELGRMVDQGARAVMLYLVQRDDCDHFRLARDIDPAYTAAFAENCRAGLEAYCYSCSVDVHEITVTRPLDVIGPS